MKKIYGVVLALVLIGSTACNKGLDNPSKVENDSLAMITGYFTGRSAASELEMARMQGMNLDQEEFLKGFKAGLQDTAKFSYFYGAMQGVQMAMGHTKDSVSLKKFFEYYQAGFQKDSTKMTMTEEQASEWYRTFMNRQQEAKAMREFGANKKAGEEALAKFAAQEGVQKTASGIAYKTLQEGNGKTPSIDEKVLVSYKGTLIDGTEFDSSEAEGREFALLGVIKGWTELLQLMKEGQEVEAYIPSELAYGAQPTGQIQPYSTLIFKIKLIKVIPVKR